ncbi:hypothetical protein [Paracoccus marcusii]|uniref:hypothetical protein n=1 Tax=Paracoccus marcusii TaxID=59779 RepID=UPI0011124DE6|nr:hypothetical protein [Paracoccus marcusii]TNB89696.1 hypothetical protein FHD68_17050 [Paracoccus marcusii]
MKIIISFFFWVLSALTASSNSLHICPTLSDKYSWHQYVGGLPLELKDPATQKSKYLPFAIILRLNDERGETANDPLGRILGSSRYTLVRYGRSHPTRNPEDFFLVSGGDDYRNCWGLHRSEIPEETGQVSIFGIRLNFDDRGRVFDGGMRYVGDLSCTLATGRDLYGVHYDDLQRGRYKGCGNGSEDPRRHLLLPQ